MQRAQPWIDAFSYRSRAYVNLKSTINDLSAELIRFERQPTTKADEALIEFCQLIMPVACEGFTKVRLGDSNDGGYVLLAESQTTGVISIGIGMNTSWDCAMARQGLAVHMFDHTIRRPPQSCAGCTFHRLGIGSENSESLRTLAEIVRVSGLQDADQLILKIDVEGAEWDALTSVDLTKFSQILLELHDLADLATARASQILDVLQGIARTHAPINVHANNYSRLVRFGSYWFPDVIEVTYANRSLLGDSVGWSVPDDPLNSPCDPRVPDIMLNGLSDLWDRVPNSR